MGWSPDPELRQMFMDELDERSVRLVEGARALRSGPVESDDAGSMMHEGHTIKGTARVLGFEAVGIGGLVVEEIWRRIQHGELERTEELAVALEALAETVVGAGEADPETGTVEHYQALARLLVLVPDIAHPELKPPDPTVGGENQLVSPVPPASTEPPSPPNELQTQSDIGVNREADNFGHEAPAASHPETLRAGEGAPIPAQQNQGTDRTDAASAMAAVRRLRTGESSAADQDQGEPSRVEETGLPAIASVTELDIPEPQLDDPLPSPPAPIAAALMTASEADRTKSRSTDLEYLIESVARWADESSLVNAGALNRLVNRLSETRSQADVMANLVGQLGDGGASEAAVHLEEVSAWLAQSTSDMLDESLGLAAVPVTNITNTLPQLVRMLADKLNKAVNFEVVGEDRIQIDRQILEQLSEPVRHVIVNALVHGIESVADRRSARKPEDANLEMRITLRDGTLEIEISDDGAGVDWEAVRGVVIRKGLLDESEVTQDALERLIFSSDVSTSSDEESPGTGNGLTVVSDVVESLFGRVRMSSEPGVGTTVTLAVPSARALEKLRLLDAAGGSWALPSGAVEAVKPINEVAVIDEAGERHIEWDGANIPLRSLSLVAGGGQGKNEQTVVVVSHRTGRVAFTVSRVRGNFELWVRHLGVSHAAPRHIFGMSYLSDGEAVLVLDAGRMVERAQLLPDERHQEVHVLVVDDSRGARAVISGALASAGLLPSVAGSVAEALEVLDEHEVDALVVDFSMPNADGVALVKEVRERKSRMPIVMLSAVANEEDQPRAKRAGVDAFFDKGTFSESVIADTLWEMLER